MRRTRVTGMLMVGLLAAMLLAGGCSDALRFAPSEAQKQNAYLHSRTLQLAASEAVQEQAGEPLVRLTQAADLQADAMLAYFGLPKQLPPTEAIEDLLSEENAAVTSQAHDEAMQRPDPWDVTDNLLEFGIALAGVVGGVYGTKAAATLSTAKQKSQALREVVQGNQLFMVHNPEQAPALKAAQAQSPATQKLVTEIKAERKVAAAPPAPTGSPVGGV